MTLDKLKCKFQGPGVCADAQCWTSTWLEELASESNTIQAWEDISVSGEIAGPDPRKLYVKMWWFFIDISGLLYSFGPASFVVLEYVVLLHWIAAGPSRESIWERLGEIKVSRVHAKVTDFIIWGRLTRPQGHLTAPGVRADAQCNITWLEELASERNTIQAWEYISVSGKIAGPDTRKLYMTMWWFSLISLDWSVRLGSRVLWV